MLLVLREVRILGLRLFKINANLPRSRSNFYWFDNLYLGWLRRRNKICGMVSDTEMLSTKPKLVLSKGDF